MCAVQISLTSNTFCKVNYMIVKCLVESTVLLLSQYLLYCYCSILHSINKGPSAFKTSRRKFRDMYGATVRDMYGATVRDMYGTTVRDMYGATVRQKCAIEAN